ncbi:MAG UNVERIFIED_CONTAM: class F sortase [Thermobifida fusca]
MLLALAGHIVAGRVGGSAPPPADPASIPASAPPADPAALPPSTPVRLTIARLGIRTPLMGLAKNPDGTVETPPLSRAQEAGWYRLGPTPGSRGAAVIIGHVDNARGPAVFHRLAQLRRGDHVDVARADGLVARFRIDHVERVSKERFPTSRVYGDPGYAAVRLITCGGEFDRATGHYRDNVIAYGHFVRGGR